MKGLKFLEGWPLPPPRECQFCKAPAEYMRLIEGIDFEYFGTFYLCNDHADFAAGQLLDSDKETASKD